MRHVITSRRREDGFTLVELLVVVIIIGILASVAIPVFLGQRQRAYDAAVQTDLKNFSKAAETTFASTLTYPMAVSTFASSGTTPITSKDTQYAAYVEDTGPGAGYAIYGRHKSSNKVFVLSSYNGGAPTTAPGWPVTSAGAILGAGADGTGSTVPLEVVGTWGTP